jgi:hypothetical protein
MIEKNSLTRIFCDENDILYVKRVRWKATEGEKGLR